MKTIATLLLVWSAAAAAQALPMQANADLKNAQGQAVGRVTLTETPHGVLMHASLTGLPEGTHAFHIHQTGACVPPFTSAGGHFNPTAKQHGIVNAMGMHAGDLPNVQVPADGKLTFDALAPGVTLDAGPNSLLKQGGTAIVMHASADDYTSDPAGNAGARIACGVVTK
ncbi:MAG: superoxide dismutase family protein [Gemmatimonadales bacterium]